jgi:predicted nucleic acid-binding protein
VIVVDTSVVVAAMNRRDAHHDVVVRWLARAEGALVTTPLALAEIDHLVTQHGGAAAAAQLYDDLDRGAYRVEWWPASAYDTVEVLREQEGLGLTDASLIAIAGRLGTIDLATLDERHFRTARPLTGEPAFRLLPADADAD